MKKGIYILIAVVVVALLYGWMTYNSLVAGNLAIDGQWAQVESQYQRRVDLIPNLVESAKGVMKQEQAVFAAIAEARTHYAGATTVDAKARAAGEVETSLGRLMAIVENYPQLKSSENVQTLMAQLEGTENRVATERMRFNDATRSYNLLTSRFPSNIVASMFGFAPRSFFEAAAGAENAPKVSF